MLGDYQIATVLTVISFLLYWTTKNTHLWRASLALTLVVGFFTDIFDLVAIGIVALLAALTIGYRKNNSHRWLFFFALVFIGLALGLHVVPGFNNHEFVESYTLTSNSAALSIWFNYDKAFFGLILLALLFENSKPTSIYDWREILKSIVPILIFGVPIVYAGAYFLGYSKIDVTFSGIFIPWAIKNLFFTVVAEEIMFRGLIQGEVARRIKSPYAGLIGVAFGSLLFGLAHVAGGVEYVILSTVAGALYGFAYHKTGKIEAAILVHFLLNVGHFLLFTYPHLA